jgi:hypothetical protein
MNSRKKTARMAGFLYLMFLVTLVFAEDAVRSKLIVFGDGAATANNIMASEGLFRIGFMSDLLSAVFFLLSAWALYVLLKPVDKNLALLFVLLILGGVAIQCINMLNQFAALLLLSGADYLKVFQADQLQALAMLFLNLYKNGFIIAQVFYGAWLFPLGYLVFKSGFLPRILGILLMIDCFGILIRFFQFFLFPDYEVITYPGLLVSLIAEFSLALWLLIMGAKDQKPAAIIAGHTA